MKLKLFLIVGDSNLISFGTREDNNKTPKNKDVYLALRYE